MKNIFIIILLLSGLSSSCFGINITIKNELQDGYFLLITFLPANSDCDCDSKEITKILEKTSGCIVYLINSSNEITLYNEFDNGIKAFFHKINPTMGMGIKKDFDNKKNTTMHKVSELSGHILKIPSDSKLKQITLTAKEIKDPSLKESDSDFNLEQDVVTK